MYQSSNICVLNDRCSQVTVDMVRRAEQANFKALVVTVDTVLLGRRLATERNEARYSVFVFQVKDKCYHHSLFKIV